MRLKLIRTLAANNRRGVIAERRCSVVSDLQLMPMTRGEFALTLFAMLESSRANGCDGMGQQTVNSPVSQQCRNRAAYKIANGDARRLVKRYG